MSRFWIVSACLCLGAASAHAGETRSARSTGAKTRTVDKAPAVRGPEKAAATEVAATEAASTEAPEASEPQATEAPATKPQPVVVPTATVVLVEYQRVGRALLKLQDQRGKFDCGDLMPRFRAIKVTESVATPQARVATAAELAAIALKIERLRGIQIDQACKDNPLAAGCS